jgi:anti-sigma B factor antagonist
VAQFEVRTSDATDHVVVALVGECDLVVREQLTSVLRDAVDRSAMVFIDVGSLTFMDSSGIHGLVMAYHAAQERGGQLYVVNATGMVASVLNLTGVAELLRPPTTATAGQSNDGSADRVTNV